MDTKQKELSLKEMYEKCTEFRDFVDRWINRTKKNHNTGKPKLTVAEVLSYAIVKDVAEMHYAMYMAEKKHPDGQLMVSSLNVNQC